MPDSGTGCRPTSARASSGAGAAGGVAIHDTHIGSLFKARRLLDAMMRHRGLAPDDAEDRLASSLPQFSAWVLGRARNALTHSYTAANGVSTIFVIYCPVTPGSQTRAVGSAEITAVLDDARASEAAHIVIVLESDPSPNAAKLLREERIRPDAIWIETFTESELQSDWSKNRLCSPHRLMSEDEVVALLRRYRATRDQLPVIHPGDKMARYLGMREGDVVEITRRSETTGHALYWRHCKDTPYPLMEVESLAEMFKGGMAAQAAKLSK